MSSIRSLIPARSPAGPASPRPGTRPRATTRRATQHPQGRPGARRRRRVSSLHVRGSAQAGAVAAQELGGPGSYSRSAFAGDPVFGIGGRPTQPLDQLVDVMVVVEVVGNDPLAEGPAAPSAVSIDWHYRDPGHLGFFSPRCVHFVDEGACVAVSSVRRRSEPTSLPSKHRQNPIYRRSVRRDGNTHDAERSDYSRQMSSNLIDIIAFCWRPTPPDESFSSGPQSQSRATARRTEGRQPTSASVR